MSTPTQLRRYVDPGSLALEPIKGEDGWYIDKKTFGVAVLFMTDDKGRIYLPTPMKPFRNPRDIHQYTIEYRLTAHLPSHLELDLSRSVDPIRGKKNWSVQVSKRKAGYKITIFAKSRNQALRLLEKLEDGTYKSFLEERRRVHRDRQRQQSSRGSSRSTPTPTKGYRRPHASERRALIDEERAA